MDKLQSRRGRQQVDQGGTVNILIEKNQDLTKHSHPHRADDQVKSTDRVELAHAFSYGGLSMPWVF